MGARFAVGAPGAFGIGGCYIFGDGEAGLRVNKKRPHKNKGQQRFDYTAHIDLIAAIILKQMCLAMQKSGK